MGIYSLPPFPLPHIAYHRPEVVARHGEHLVADARNHLYFHTPSEPPLFKGDSRDVKNKK